MIVGGVVLNKRDLLEREVTPILIDVYKIIFLYSVGLCDYGKNAFSILCIEKREDIIVAVASEILAVFNRHGNHHQIIVKQNGAFKRAGGRGRSGVYNSLVGIAFESEIKIEVTVLTYVVLIKTVVRGINTEHIGAAE